MDPETGAPIFKALADPQRLRVLHLLAHPPVNACAAPGSVCACDITTHLGLSQPTVSHHMRLLVQAGLVTATRRGKWMVYTLNTPGFEAAEAQLRTLRTASGPPADTQAAQPGARPRTRRGP